MYTLFILLAIATKVLFPIMAVAAFGSFISFIQINSAASDRKGLHKFWLIMGIVLALVALFLLYLVVQQSGSAPSRK